MLEVLAGSWIAFWVLTILLVASVITSLKYNYFKVSFAAVILYFLGLEFVIRVGVFSWVYTHPLYFGLGLLGYFVGGTLIVWPKWKWYVDDELEFVEECYKTYIYHLSRGNLISNTYHLSKSPSFQEAVTLAKRGELHADFAQDCKSWILDRVNSRRGYSVNSYAPRVSEHKQEIMSWMTFWPIVLVESIFADIIVKIFRSIYNRIAGTLQKISDSAFKDFDSKLQKTIDSKREINE